MKKKILSLALRAVLFALCVRAEAQQPGKVYRIGYLSSGRGIEVREEAFRPALREFAYIDGDKVIK